MAKRTDKRKKKTKKKHRFFWFLIKLQIVLMVVVLAGFGYYYFGGYATEVQALKEKAVQTPFLFRHRHVRCMTKMES